MRRAVRDYKYEVNEGRMTEECNQYLQQLQKDWERHRVKMGVEQLRREVSVYPHQFKCTPRVLTTSDTDWRTRTRPGRQLRFPIPPRSTAQLGTILHSTLNRVCSTTLYRCAFRPDTREASLGTCEVPRSTGGATRFPVYAPPSAPLGPTHARSASNETRQPRRR